MQIKIKAPHGAFIERNHIACSGIDAEQALQSLLWVAAMRMAESPTRT